MKGSQIPFLIPIRVVRATGWILAAIGNEILAGTKHFNAKTGFEANTVAEIFELYKTENLTIEYHCRKCGTVMEKTPITERYCEECKDGSNRS